MKIRIKGNSIRYRLTKSEVALFASEGIIQEDTNFNNRTLSYVLQRTDAANLTAEFVADTIILHMPKQMAGEWTSTERVGFEGQNGLLTLSIEKDFQCLDNVAEDQSDNYPNPLAAQNHHEQN